MDELVEFVENLGGVLTLHPQPGDGTPEIAWGDYFFYYAPDGVLPRTQPFATIVTKDYPGDETSQLNRPNIFRINIAAGKELFEHHTGHAPRDHPAPPTDTSTPDVIFAHPVYTSQAWLAVVSPGPITGSTVRDLLRAAHTIARLRYEKREPHANN